MTDHIKGLLFDKDGTLFDFRTTWGAWADRFFREAAQDDEVLAANMARQLGYDFEAREFSKSSVIIAGTPEDITMALVDVIQDKTPAEIVETINRLAVDVPQAEPVPLIPLLEGFRTRGLKLGVATNDAEEPARAHLGSAGVVELFDFIAGFDSGYGGKPATGMQIGFCASVGLAPEQVIMVGDSLHDLISGRDAGMMTIAVLTGMADADDLAPFADVVLPHIGDIPEFLGHS